MYRIKTSPGTEVLFQGNNFDKVIMVAKNTKNLLLSCAVIVLVTCMCLGLILAAGVGLTILRPINIGHDQAVTPPTHKTLEEPPATLTPEADLPSDVAEIVLEIEAQVSQIRGLSLQTPVPRILISPEELQDIVMNEFFADYSDEDARQDVLVLSLLGLLPADFDLKNFYNDLYSEQISGFYDSETGEIYLLKGTNFGGSEKLTYAHEFTHVLQDQTYKFDAGLNYNDEACEKDSEFCAAIQSLIEGDASLTEVLWFQTYANRADYLDIMQTYEDFSSPVLDAAPPYMALDLYFPYEKGFTFVEFLYNEGGFDAVNAAFENPPLSTEHILHPERYPWDEPVTVIMPNLEETLGPSWVLFDQNVMGEWYTYLILSQAYEEAFRISEGQAKAAAEGWGGDTYTIYLNENSDEVIFILNMIWDSTIDADEFIAALTHYADQRWDAADQQINGQLTWKSNEGTVVLTQAGDRTLWIITPTDVLAEVLLLELQ
jgi:hypothetical protein